MRLLTCGAVRDNESMLSLEECRKLDGDAALLSDEELRALREWMYRAARLAIEHLVNNNEKGHGDSKLSPMGIEELERSGYDGTV